jgi:serine/threonine protein kinase
VLPVIIAVAVAFILFVCCAGAVRWRRSGQGRAKWHTVPPPAPVDDDYWLLPAAISWVYETAQEGGSAAREQNRVKLGNGQFGIVYAAAVALDTTPTTPTLKEELRSAPHAPPQRRYCCAWAWGRTRPGAGRTIDVAIKSPLLDKEQMSPLLVEEVLADFEREMRINVIIAQEASKGSDSFIAKLFGCVPGATPMLVLERCHGNLKEALVRERPGGVDATRPADPSLRGLQVARALAFLENIDIVHRDVAARNVLLVPSAGNVLICKLADFGCARELGDQKQCFEPNAKLAPAWMPPETLRKHVFTPASDRWSFGILLWEIYTQGSEPYPQVELNDLADHIEIPSNRPEREATKIPQEAYNLMKKCWAAEPEMRPSAAELISALGGTSPPPRPPPTPGWGGARHGHHQAYAPLLGWARGAAGIASAESTC